MTNNQDTQCPRSFCATLSAVNSQSSSRRESDEGRVVKGALPQALPFRHTANVTRSRSGTSESDSLKEDDGISSFSEIQFSSNVQNAPSQEANDACLYKRGGALNDLGENLEGFENSQLIRDMGKLCMVLNSNRKSLSGLDIASLVAAEKSGLGGVDASFVNDIDENEAKTNDDDDESGYVRRYIERTDERTGSEDDCKVDNDDDSRSEIMLPEVIDVSDPEMSKVFLEAVGSGDISVTRRLVRAGIPLRKRHMQLAAERNHIGVLQYLLVQVPRSLRVRLAKSALSRASLGAHEFLVTNYALY